MAENATPERAISALMIDDDEMSILALQDYAKRRGIYLTARHNLRDGLRELEANYSRYFFLVLDTHCYLDADDQTAEMDFIIRAMHEVDALATAMGRKVPYCIYTSDAAMRPLFDKWKCRVFLKDATTEALDELCVHILNTFEQTSRGDFTLKYPHIAAYVTRSLGAQAQQSLFQAFETIDSEEQCLSNLRAIRTAAEAVFARAWRHVAQQEPLEGGRRLLEMAEILYQNGDLPKHLYYVARNLYFDASRYAAHDHVGLNPMTRFTAQHFFCGLLDVIEWLRRRQLKDGGGYAKPEEPIDPRPDHLS